MEKTLIGIAAAHTPGWPKVDWVEQAAKNLGHDVVRCYSASELPELLSCCDVVILGHKSLAGRWPNIRKAMENRSCPVVYWWFDLVATEPGSPLEQQVYFKTWKTLFDASDVVLVKEKGLLHEYHEQGIKAYWLDQGCPSTMPECRPSDKEWDLLVWGQSGGYTQRVFDARKAAKSGFKVAWAGSVVDGVECLPSLPPDELPELASRARCVLSCGRRNDIEGYWSDQFWMATGMGATVVRKHTKGLPEGPYHKYFLAEDLMGILRVMKESPEECEEIGRKAREWVMQNHTIEHRIQELLKVVRTATGRDIKPARKMASDCK